MTLFQNAPRLQRPVAQPLQLADVEPATPVPRRPPAPAPLLPVAIGVILGIVLDYEMTPPRWATLMLVAVGATLVLMKGRRAAAGFLGLMVSAAGLGALRHDLAFRGVAANHIVHFTQREPILAKVRARVLSSPEIIEPDLSIPHAFERSPRTRFVMEALEVAGREDPIVASGKVAMSVQAPVLLLETGDIIEMTGWLYRPRGPANPGGFDWSVSLRRSGILAAMTCQHAESIKVIARSEISATASTGAHWSLAANTWLGKMRARMGGYLLHHAFDDDEPGAGVIEAMVLGQRGAVSKAMNDAFVRTGNAHFLAASGMNVAWLALTGWGLMRLLGVYYRYTAVFVGLLILSYVLLAEPEPSILRAGVVGLLGCLAIFLRGRANGLNWLACAAIVVLMIDPCDVFRAGFQLSFIGVLAVMHFSKVIRQSISRAITDHGPPFISDLRVRLSDSYPASLMSPEHSWSTYVLRGLINASSISISVGIACWIATVPLTCYMFGQFAPYGVMGTLILWLPAFLATLVGYLKVLLGLVFPSSAIIFGPLLSWTTGLMTGVVDVLAKLPGALIDGRSPSLAWVLACYALIAWRTYGHHLTSRDSPEDTPQPRPIWRRHGFKLLVCLLIAWWALPLRWFTLDSKAVQVWMLAVGDGTGTVIELPSGHVVLCDLGTRSSLDATAQASGFLKWRGIRRIDTVFVSHADFDHYSGIEALAREFEVGRIVINDHFQPYLRETSAAAQFLAAMRELRIPIESTSGNYRWADEPGVELESIWPPLYAQRTLPDTNDRSTVLRLAYQGRSILLPGDIADPALSALVAQGHLKADVLALPHHGSVVANTAAFIDAVNPVACIRSTGQRQSMTVNGIGQAVGARKYFSTADDGCVRVRMAEGTVIAEAIMKTP